MARIIYVEDDDLMGSVVRDILTTAGHRIDVIAHGTLGFEAIASSNPDLVILDLTLPGMDGLAMVHALRQIPAACFTPILILTSNRDETVSDAALRAGANDFMTKPFSPEELVARIDLVLRRNPRTKSADESSRTTIATSAA